MNFYIKDRRAETLPMALQVVEGKPTMIKSTKKRTVGGIKTEALFLEHD